MNTDMALSIAKRFVTQPLDKRKIYLEKMHAENISPVNLPIPAVKELFDAIPLSYAQQRQWFLWQLEPDSAAYNMSAALRLKGTLNVEALRQSFETLIARHETLRTTFRQDGEQAIQIIHPATRFPLAVETLSTESGVNLEETLKTLVEGETQYPFDLEHGPLLRVKLLRFAEDDHALILTMHHIVSDGWSMPIMVGELIQLYDGYRNGHAISLPELPIQYADYAIWQRNWMEAGEQERQLTYWKAKLGDEQPVLELPTDHLRPTVQSHAGASLPIEITPELSRSLKQLAQQQGVTLFMLLLASFQTLLHRYSGQDDIRVGVPIANRNRVETERLIGFFVNTQVLKADFGLETTFNELLQQIKRTTLEAQAYQDLPFEQLVEVLQPERSMSHSPLFQVMFNHQMETHGNAQQLPGLQLEGLSREKQTAQFDLTLDTFEHSTGIGASLTYATALFEAGTLRRLADHWLSLLHAIAQQPEQRISELPLLSEKEQQQIVYDWNRTAANYPSDQCIHQLIEAQAEKTPDAVAVVFGNQELTYQQLNQKANQLAHKLRELGIGPDILAGIAVDRSMEMVLGLLAILKAGGAYVPLDPEYPQERLAYMMEHSNAGLLLTQHHLLDQLPVANINIWCLDRDWHELEGYSNANLHTLVDPEHLAYCIYTSGSTGKPKGVAVRHQALTNFLASMALQPGIQTQDKVLALTSLSFDIAGLELYLPLLVGASVIILANQQKKDPQALLELIQNQSVSIIQATPSTWRMLLDAIPAGALAGCKLLCGGEALASDLASRMIEQAGHVWNLYGPTETTIWSGLHYLDAESPAPYLGKPIANTALRILDRAVGVAPPSVAGELLIGGHGLARGYLHRPDLTAERFIPDPLDESEQGGGRLYRTGDLAQYRADGVMEYISRIDHQVKIRGFRIELGEIETRLQEHAAVHEAAVIDVEGPSGRQLAAYLVPADLTLAQSDNHQLATVLRDELRAHLRIALPDYMAPSHLVFLEKMPLTPNGKLDRKALPKPDSAVLKRSTKLPRTRLERKLSAIWQEVLQVDSLGLQDDFFELGGHSLLALAVVQKIRSQIDKSFSAYDFMMHPTIEQQASKLRSEMEVFKSSLIKLNTTEKSKPSIYCLPPGGGTVFPYYPLAHALNGSYNVYALLNRAFVDQGKHYKSWDEMVSFYLDEIKRSQPEGPYRLLGWSTGGAMAWDISRRLEAAGQSVDWLGLIDPTLPAELSHFYVSANVGADAEPMLDPASLDTRNQEAVRFIQAFFPEKGEAYLVAKVTEGRELGLQDEALVDFLLKDLAEGKGLDHGLFLEIYNTYAQAAELVVGYETFEKIAQLSKDIRYEPLNVTPVCWWSSLMFQSPRLLEHHLRGTHLLKDIISSHVLDVAHQQMVMSSVFLDTLKAELVVGSTPPR